MSYIDELIDEMCPYGVAYKPLAAVANIVGGRDYRHLGEGDIPVYGSGGLMTYVDTAAYDKPTVLLPRKGSISNVFYLEEPFWNVDTVFYTEIDTAQIHPRFFYHVILNEHIEKLNTSNAARPALTRVVLNKIPIPVPPMEIQREVVRVLDSFAELEAELEARKAQYAHYRDRLLSRESLKAMAGGEDIRRVAISDILKSTKKRTVKQSELIDDGEYPVVNSGRNYYGYLNEWNNEGDAITVAARGEYAGFIRYEQSRFFAGGLCYPYIVKDSGSCSAKYVFYVLKSSEKTIREQLVARGSIPAINKGDFDRFELPLPPLHVQQRVVDILDRFDALTTSLTDGLPAEIDARRKQYAYYRDKLLSFREKVA